MIQDDTVKLLRECDAGIRMGVDSIDEVMDKVKSQDMQQVLSQCRHEHQRLSEECCEMLHEYHDEGQDPDPIAEGMSWMKTNIKWMMDRTDATVADLMTDGCNMGVKSLSRYLNQYEAADEKSKDICKKLIALEGRLAEDLRGYL